MKQFCITMPQLTRDNDERAEGWMGHLRVEENECNYHE